jgi:pcsB protein
LKKSLLIAPAIIGAVAFGSKTALADEISTQSSNNIETKTVYYSGNASAKMDENSQDSLVSNKHYQAQEDSNTGVSATILSDENDSTTKELLSEKALTEVNSSEKLTEADKAKIAKEKEEKEAEEARKAEEERKEKEKARAKSEESSYSYTNQSYSSSETGVDGQLDIQPDYSGNTYPVGQCTWGAKALAPWVHNYWGNANQWPDSARAAGYSVGTQPRVGAVICWPYEGWGYGHVAVVTAVSGNQIQVKESNWGGNQYISNFRGWFTPDSSVVYIYPN